MQEAGHPLYLFTSISLLPSIVNGVHLFSLGAVSCYRHQLTRDSTPNKMSQGKLYYLSSSMNVMMLALSEQRCL